VTGKSFFKPLFIRKLRDEMAIEGMRFVREERNAHINNLRLIELLEEIVSR